MSADTGDPPITIQQDQMPDTQQKESISGALPPTGHAHHHHGSHHRHHKHHHKEHVAELKLETEAQTPAISMQIQRTESDTMIVNQGTVEAEQKKKELKLSWKKEKQEYRLQFEKNTGFIVVELPC